jgi:hypothetical protein
MPDQDILVGGFFGALTLMFLMWACLVWLATTAIAMVLLALSGVPSVEVIGRAIKVSADTCVRLARQVEEMLHDIPLLVREVVAVVLPPLLVLALAQHGSPAHSSVLGVALVRDAATSVSTAMAESLAGQVPVVEAWVPALVVANLLLTRQAVRLVTWLGHCDDTPPELLGVGEPVPSELGYPPSTASRPAPDAPARASEAPCDPGRNPPLAAASGSCASAPLIP